MSEPNGYEQQLFTAIDNLATIALRAYWHNKSDCGADMGEHCTDCKHYVICECNRKLHEALKTLKEWGCVK